MKPSLPPVLQPSMESNKLNIYLFQKDTVIAYHFFIINMQNTIALMIQLLYNDIMFCQLQSYMVRFHVQLSFYMSLHQSIEKYWTVL